MVNEGDQSWHLTFLVVLDNKLSVLHLKQRYPKHRAWPKIKIKLCWIVLKSVQMNGNAQTAPYVLEGMKTQGILLGCNRIQNRLCSFTTRCTGRLVLLSLLLGVCGHQSSSPLEPLLGARKNPRRNSRRFPIHSPAGRGEALHNHSWIHPHKDFMRGFIFWPQVLQTCPERAQSMRAASGSGKIPPHHCSLFPVSLHDVCLLINLIASRSTLRNQCWFVLKTLKAITLPPRALPSTPEYINTFLL